MTRRLAVRIAIALVMMSVGQSGDLLAADWIQVHGGKKHGISGMALLTHRDDLTRFVVVHDNKGEGEPRLAVVTVEGREVDYAKLKWPEGTALPVDLESISSVPDHPGNFVALESSGCLFAFAVEDRAVKVLGKSTLPDPPQEPNFEGFSLQKVGGQLIVAWGHRGAGRQPGVLFWGTFDWETKTAHAEGKNEITVPYPAPTDANTRHISDLKLDANGVVWASAANDRGDDGLFVSAIYTLGLLRSKESGRIDFEPNAALTRLWTFRKRKVEAIELVPGKQGGIAFGTDDENDGGWLLFR